jgi:phosphoribosylamine--glycine ligase
MNKLLIIGSGGREHALGWKLAQSPKVSQIFFAPGNAGTSKVGENIDIAVEDIDGLVAWAKENKPDLTVVGPEVPLTRGVVDAFEKEGLPIFGPTQKAARLESSKAWTAQFMDTYNIPQPRSATFTDPEKAKLYLNTIDHDVVVKASGLAAGKGVLIPDSREETIEAIERIMVQKEFGNAGDELVFQEKLTGTEVSIFALSDGKTVTLLPSAQDHKRIFDNDQGPNTGGMGAYVPAPFVTDDDLHTIKTTIIEPTIEGMRTEGCPYKGVLYAGIMMTQFGPKILEYNVRFGDPECQPLMMMIESDMFEILDACVRGRLTPSMVQVRDGAAACVVLAAGGYPGSYEKGTEIHGLEMERDEDVQVFHAGTKPVQNRILTNGGRVLGVTAYGNDLKESLAKAYRVIGPNGVHFEGMQYRTDIGKKGLN